MQRDRKNYKVSPRDNCQTPGYGVEPLFHSCGEFIAHNVSTIWESAAGEGYMSQALADISGKAVFASDITTGVDFLTMEPPCGYDAIITNPPFALKKEFIRRCYALEKPWALLMPADIASNKYFIDMVNEHSPKPGIIWVSPRINFKMPFMAWRGNGASFNIAWYTWNMGFTGNHFIRMPHWTTEYRKTFEKSLITKQSSKEI